MTYPDTIFHKKYGNYEIFHSKRRGYYNMTSNHYHESYESVTHFGRVFKQITGMSPLVYSKSTK